MTRRVQAGAIAFRSRGAQPEFLLVTRKNSHQEWLFPKGNVKTDDSLEETALKELREEAGVEGVIVDRVGTITVKMGGERVEVTYFLVHSGFSRPNGEGRKIRWLTQAEAEPLLNNGKAVNLLRRAARRLS
ncbi:MAG TPA: NUDIX domain-containing protein [Gemmatimonadales bacterium]